MTNPGRSVGRNDRRRRALVVSWLSLVALPAAASAQILNFHHYTNTDGLPQASVLDVAQDGTGYLWFGTYAGLSRYDGHRFHTYTTADGLPGNGIKRVRAWGEDRLLVGTTGGGACVFQHERFRCVGEDEGLPSAWVLDILPASDGTVWIATTQGVAAWLPDGEVRAYTVAEGLPDPVVTVVAETDDGILVGTGSGIARLVGDRFARESSDVVGDQPVTVALRTPRGVLVGGSDGLYLREGSRYRTVDVPAMWGERVVYTDATNGPNGEIWLSTNRGALEWDQRGFHRLTRTNGLLTDDLTGVFLDREQSIWFCGDEGASKLVEGPLRLYTAADGLPSPFVRTIAEDPAGRLWIGTRQGLAVRRGRGFVPVALRGLPDVRVLSIAGLPDGSHLVGTYDDGLVHLDGERQTRYTVDDGLPSGIVNAILPTGESGAAWVATDGGVVEWRSGRILPAPHPDVANAVALEMTPGPDGELWFALRTGGALIWRGNEVHALGAAEGLTDQIVWAVRRDRSGRMWLGSNGDGAFVVEHGAITRLGQTEGLANPFVWQILPDERGDVWMYTNQGLDRYRDGAFRHYGRADGLFEPEGNTTAALESSDGTLWFGTVTGLYRYTAADERPNLVAPPIVIEEVHVEDVGRLAPGAEVPPRPGMVAVRLAALSFRDEASVRYRYRLIGLDDRWSPPISRPELSWTGLPPGRYRLEVVGVNDSGVASRTAAAFPFRILPAFWQTWRFRIALGLLFAGAVGAVPLARARHLDRERRRLERVVAARTEALRESEARVRDILEHSTNLFYSRAPSGEITYLSPQSERYLRCAQDERLTWDDVVSDDRHSRAASALACTLVAGGLAPSPYELELARRDGGRTWVEVNEAPLIRDGKVVSVVGAFTDITERKRGEMERALLEEQLRQSQKMEAIGRLAGGIAHDFNNLLTSVMGHAALATETLGRDHEVAADLEEVRIASERAAKLVAQLLAFGRRQIIQPTVLDLNAGVTEATRMLERLLGEDLRLDCVLDERTPPVRMDPGQLDQILVNLALNARENMPTGGTLTISTAPGALSRALDEGVVEGPCAMLRVRDTGHGMDEATRARVFEPFFTTKAVGEGSGLGLATVYGIVKQNHGHISVESAPGAGATFDVLIPAASTGAATDTSARRRAVASPAGAGDSETVLLVEDQDDVRAVLATTLERAGFRVLAASDGASAYATAIAERGRIAILVTDMVMPGMSGKEVAERVTAVHPETGVLFVSGYTDEALGMRGVLVPETEWLQKPFAPGTLVERVRGILPGEGKGPTVN